MGWVVLDLNVMGSLSVLWSDVQRSRAWVRDVGFMFSWPEWIMELPGGPGKRERKALGRGRGRAKGLWGTWCVVRGHLQLPRVFILSIYS